MLTVAFIMRCASRVSYLVHHTKRWPVQIFFDVNPFQGMNHYQIMRSVTSGVRPDRLENPNLEDEAWNLIQSCWKPQPSERSTMEQILETFPNFDHPGDAARHVMMVVSGAA